MIKFDIIIILGTKSDLRVEDSKKFVTEIAGNKMKKKIDAKAFVECSAKNKERLTEVFEHAVKSLRKLSKYQQCKIL